MDTHFHFWMASACLNANWNRKFWMIGKWSGSGIGIGMGSRWPSSPSAHFHISCSDTLENIHCEERLRNTHFGFIGKWDRWIYLFKKFNKMRKSFNYV